MADQNAVKEKDAPVKARGLEGVIALESELSSIDGQKGELIYRGYTIEDLPRTQRSKRWCTSCGTASCRMLGS